ncbi:hypothetical protein CRG98_009881 [Punica granatum]|nr:hypothetical protein CRG98_009881 [Punica granatum]
MEEKLVPDYFTGQVDGFPHHCYPDYPHFGSSPSFTTLPSSSSKSSTISFTTSSGTDAPDAEAADFDYKGRGSPVCANNNMAAMREMIFRIAAMQPINIDPEAVKPPKRRNVRISSDPQSVAARHRRERISERIQILQRLVPGGTKMDTASMLDEAIHYVKFLKRQVQSLERASHADNDGPGEITLGLGFPMPVAADHDSRAGYIDSSTNSMTKGMPSYHYRHQLHAPAQNERNYANF